MVTKIIFIGYQPLTKKVIEDFYFRNLEAENYKIQYWDLTEIYFKHNSLENSPLDVSILYINSLTVFESLIQRQDLDKTLFISNITFEFRSLSIYRILSKYKCKTSFFARGALPSIKLNTSFNSLFYNLHKIIDIRVAFNFLKNKYAFLLKKNGIIKAHKIIFRAGNEGMKTIGAGSDIDSKCSQIVDVNSFDYDNYVKSANSQRLFKYKYCVYLDEYLPFHPDFALFNIKTVDPDQFYKVLNNFFDLLEEQFCIKIVVAAHPKAEKYKNNNFFNGRAIVFGKTAELIRDSEFVLFHCSTSISFAVLNSKPILSLNTNIIKKDMPNYFNYIEYFSRVLETNLINIDNINSSKVILPVPNSKKYSAYVYDYLTSFKSEGFASSKIFIDTIRGL